MSDDDTPDPDAVDAIRVWRLLWWTVPLHALLPLMIAGLGWAWEREMSWAWLIVHVGFLVALVCGYPWWRGQGEVVGAVILINHFVTFAVGAGVVAWVWG